MNIRYLSLILILLVTIIHTEAAPDMRQQLEDRLARLESAPDDKTAIRDVAHAYILLGDYDSAGIYADKLMKIAEETGDRDFAGLSAARIMVQVACARGDTENAYRMLEYARVIAENLNDHEALAYVHNGFILYYATLVKDDYAAISHCYKGLEETRLSGDEYRESIILSNLAELYNDRFDPEGLEYARQAYELSKKLDDRISLFYSSLTLADAYMIQGKIREAGKILDEAKTYAKELGYERSIELVLVNAIYHFLSGDTATAIDLCEHAFNCDFHDPSRAVVMRTYLTYARILNKTGNPKKALEIADEGLAYAKGFHLSSYVGDLMKEIAEANRMLGNYETALDYTNRYVALVDSTYRMGREQAMIDNRIKYEIYDQDRRIREKEQELRASRMRNWILAGALVVLGCFVLFVLESYRRKKRLYRAIVAQNSEYLAREQVLLEQIERAQAESSQGGKPVNPLTEEKADDIMSRFTLLMTEEKLFRDPSLNIGAVADRLDSNRTYVSRAINDSGKSFTQIVNDYRIREAIAMISDLDANIPLKQICSDVGFSSSSTFYSTFQAVTGMTPA
ncbi:MAG: helix-turn-helix domain-containing protein, partial [Duncaniella sp.]|nr:helix-turn-helix domain-containing protein [Duncaniella sp.]